MGGERKEEKYDFLATYSILVQLSTLCWDCHKRKLFSGPKDHRVPEQFPQASVRRSSTKWLGQKFEGGRLSATRRTQGMKILYYLLS